MYFINNDMSTFLSYFCNVIVMHMLVKTCMLVLLWLSSYVFFSAIKYVNLSVWHSFNSLVKSFAFSRYLLRFPGLNTQIYKYTKHSQMADRECHLSKSAWVPGHNMLSVTVYHLMESNIKILKHKNDYNVK